MQRENTLNCLKLLLSCKQPATHHDLARVPNGSRRLRPFACIGRFGKRPRPPVDQGLIITLEGGTLIFKIRNAGGSVISDRQAVKRFAASLSLPSGKD